jgi:hypothetical protein
MQAGQIGQSVLAEFPFLAELSQDLAEDLFELCIFALLQCHG